MCVFVLNMKQCLSLTKRKAPGHSVDRISRSFASLSKIDSLILRAVYYTSVSQPFAFEVGNDDVFACIHNS